MPRATPNRVRTVSESTCSRTRASTNMRLPQCSPRCVALHPNRDCGHCGRRVPSPGHPVGARDQSKDPIMNTDSAAGRVPEGPTGRQIITFAPVDDETATRELRDVAGFDIGTPRGLDDPAAVATGDVYLDKLGIAIVDSAPEQLGALSRAVGDSASPIIAVEPEVYVYPFDTIDAMDAPPATVADDSDAEADDDEVDAAETYVDTDTYAWGLKAVRAVPPILATAPWAGAGIRIAVLDTGIDLGHPDFAGRVIASQSFIPGAAVQDGHSHGTHCAGTAAGPKSPPGTQRRYGVAHGARLLVGKVLSDQGSGTSGQILAGIQ